MSRPLQLGERDDRLDVPILLGGVFGPVTTYKCCSSQPDLALQAGPAPPPRSAGPPFWVFCGPMLLLPIPEAVMGAEPSPQRFALLCPEPNVHEHMRLLPERVEISVSARSQAEGADERRGKSNKTTQSLIPLEGHAAGGPQPSAALPPGGHLRSWEGNRPR